MSRRRMMQAQSQTEDDSGIPIGVNLVDADKITTNHYVASNLKVAEIRTLNLSDYIAVKPGQTYELANSAGAWSAGAWYDSTKAPILTLRPIVYDGTFILTDIPEGAAFVRINLRQDGTTTFKRLT